MFMASGALWTAVQDSWKSLGEAGVEQLGMAQGRFDRGDEGPGRGDRAQLWASEACEESPSCTSAHLGGQEGDSIRASHPAGLEAMDVCVCAPDYISFRKETVYWWSSG